jgi:hypothetical protein
MTCCNVYKLHVHLNKNLVLKLKHNQAIQIVSAMNAQRCCYSWRTGQGEDAQHTNRKESKKERSRNKDEKGKETSDK